MTPISGSGWSDSRRLTFDLSGVPKARPLEGRVRPTVVIRGRLATLGRQ